jgi:hypothetical protein
MQPLSQNTDIGDATGLRGSGDAGQLFLALHSADPGEVGTQATSEVTYTGYARVAVVRSEAGFVAAAASEGVTKEMDFPACTEGSVTATHFSVGSAATGAGLVLHKGELFPPMRIFAGVTPRMLRIELMED